MNNIIAHETFCPSCYMRVPAGSVRRYACEKCGKTYRYCDICAAKSKRKCGKCGSDLKMDHSIFKTILDVIFPFKFMR